MRKVLIIAGGRADDTFVGSVMDTEKPSAIIAADRGTMVLDRLGIVPDYLVGDFDSSDVDIIEKYKGMFGTLGKPVIKQFCPEKDDTDTEIAIKTALTLSPDEIIITGATGTRLDHTLANIELLMMPLAKGINAYIIDEYNKITLHDRSFTIKKDSAYGKYFSLIPFTEEVKGLSIHGAKYELSDFTMTSGNSLGVSNEIVRAKVSVDFTEGILTVFETDDAPLKEYNKRR